MKLLLYILIHLKQFLLLLIFAFLKKEEKVSNIADTLKKATAQ